MNLRGLSKVPFLSGLSFLRFLSNILKRHGESQSESPCKYGLADWLSLSRPLRNFNFINSAKIFPSGLLRPVGERAGGQLGPFSCCRLLGPPNLA